jgi:hypothetical protein
MKPLVLTSLPPPSFTRGGFPDVAICLTLFRFVWGQLPSQAEIAGLLGRRTPGHDEMHWSDWGRRWNRSENREHRDLSLADFCQRYEIVELWFDVDPEAQLALIWLLDHLRAYPETVTRLKLRLVDQDMQVIEPDEIGNGMPPVIDVTEKELATAQAAWQAYRSSTPEACVDLLQQDLSALPMLKPVLLDLLTELPSTSTGLGASEMRMLEMIGRGYSLTDDLFDNSDIRQTYVFDELEYGYLLDGLAFGPTPAVVGLDEALRTMPQENLEDRQGAYKRSRLSLTDFGKAVVAHKEDFSRYNPIDRWWGGTHLTNDNLWRWSPALVKPRI